MPRIFVTKERVSESHSFWMVTVTYEVGDVVKAYGQSLSEALGNMAKQVKLREVARMKADRVRDEVEAA